MIYVIIGNGPAGVSAIERIREIDVQGRIILISKENNLPYSRIMTPEYMTGEVKAEDLYNRGADFYEKNQVETYLGRTAEKVHPDDNHVELDNGEVIAYDQLLIASGSRPVFPAFVDLTLEGVFTLWDKADSENIGAYLSGVKKAVIVGGGLVGLQAARTLAAYGIQVTLIERMNRLMPLQLDEAASSMVLTELHRHNIEVFLNTEVMSLDTKGHKISAIRIKDREIPADMVVFATGVRPNLEMVYSTSLDREQGLRVNKQMQTNIRNIYAAGDVAEAYCRLTGEQKLRALWPCAVQQGKIAGANMAGKEERYAGSIAMNSFQLFNMAVISLGMIEPSDAIEERFLMHPATGSYQKLFLKEGKLQGLIFAGNIQPAGILFSKMGSLLNQGYCGTFPSIEVDNIFI